ALGVLDESVDDAGILAVDGDADAADVAGGGQALAELGPVGAAVDGLVEAAGGTAAVIAERGAAALVGRRIQRVGAVAVEGDIDHAGVLVDEEDVRPGFAAVGGFVDAALFVGSPEMAEGGDVGGVGIGGMDGDAADVVGIAESQVGPGLAAV